MAFCSPFKSIWVCFAIILSISIIMNVLYFFQEDIKIADVVSKYLRFARDNKTTFETCANAPSPRIQSVTQSWQPVGNRSDVFVFSAYFNKEKKAVQIVGIALLNVKVDCICTFTTSATAADEDRKPVQGLLEIVPEHHSRRYSAMVIRCPVPEHIWPVTVNVTVRNATASLNITYASSERYNFSVCVPALFGPFKNPKSIIEMVELDLLLGADRFVFYNESITPLVNTVLEHYTKKGIVKIIPWNLPVRNIHYHGQLASIQDCLYANKGKSKFLILKDLDEFVVPHKHENWHELLQSVNDSKHTNASAYLFRNAFFNLDFGVDVNGYERKSDSQLLHLVSMLYVWRDKSFLPARQRSKMIVLPDRVEILGIHFIWKSVQGFKEVTIEPNVAFLHHYRKWKTKTKVKDGFMRKYADRLIQNVNRTLSLIGLSNTTGI
ncbi:beta-1,4-galactosyltransferase galt-1-like [Haliotis asinina]|uniref:beta-1,4-galactosyltransferase galt-1-like n=1 Tax=Haliotis asinina TaxID=109174 RepID=UPI0035325554